MLQILLAEDNDLVRHSLSLLLDYEDDISVVEVATDGQEALAKIQNIEVNIIVTDLNMPKMNGFELIKEIRKRRPEVHVVVLSSHDTTPYIARAFQLGASAYLTKNHSADELIFALRRVSKGEKYLCADVSMSIFKQYCEYV